MSSLRKEVYLRELDQAGAPERVVEAAVAIRPAAREIALAMVRRLASLIPARPDRSGPATPAQRLARWRRESAERLAAAATLRSDEHGSKWTRGDHVNVEGLDYVAPYQSRGLPYMDSGGEGLGLVAVHRRRVYAKSSGCQPSEAEWRFMVGRNETGTYFAHPVPNTVASVREAEGWIWHGLAGRIVQRQGDIALVQAPGPRYPSGGLPAGHELVLDVLIVHSSHPPLPSPARGQRIIVARRSRRDDWAVRD